MYERNAIVIDRYFADMFGYNDNSNLKNNCNNYFELVSQLEKYQEISETEDDMMAEFEKIASEIKETQKLQEILNKRNLKYNETRKNLFENLDEDADFLNKKFQKLEDEIDKNNQEIKANTERFIEEIREFNEKSETRSKCGRERRFIENDYQRILSDATNGFNNINKDKLRQIKSFLKQESDNDVKEKIKEKILKNGAKEKVPFDLNVVTSAIEVSTDIEEKKIEILLSIYDKTMKILDEIKNDTVKIEKHKKSVKDAESKLKFLNVISEYIILFLDNERMNIMGGEKEHKKIMEEACNNLQKDLVEIKKMYSLLIKEITAKSSKKAYKELYNPEYLRELQDEEKKFEKSISKLNMIGTVIYPDYWRIEGMQKIFDTFRQIMTETYEKDLSEYEPLDITCDVNEDMFKLNDLKFDEDLDNEEDDDWNFEDELQKEDDNTETDNEDDDFAEDDDESENDEDDDWEEESSEDEADEENEDNEEDDDYIWDDDDDELDFGNNDYILKEDEEDDDENDTFEEKDNTVIEEETEEDKRDKEIDKILGFFEDSDSFDEEDDDLANNSYNFELDENEDDYFQKIAEQQPKGVKKRDAKENDDIDDDNNSRKKKSLFGRKRK